VTVFEAGDAAGTKALGARLAGALRETGTERPFVVTLAGDLGAGKTTFVAGLLAALGHGGPVRSPTYTLIEPYQFAGRDWYHCDFYRLRHADELDDLGWRDLLVPGAILLVEWPEKGAGRLGPVDLAIEIEYVGAAGRRVKFEAVSPAGLAVLAAL
jgi:tRNA threonylcarbamoyladenosine biosynthesis protein TsaE